MRILLDTRIFLWCVNNDKHLSRKARAIIMDASDIFVSSASIWEVSIKIHLGKLDVDINDLMNAISESGFQELKINIHHAAGVAALPNYHRDPFDRMLISQAIYEPLHFITADAILKQYSSLVELV